MATKPESKIDAAAEKAYAEAAAKKVEAAKADVAEPKAAAPVVAAKAAPVKAAPVKKVAAKAAPKKAVAKKTAVKKPAAKKVARKVAPKTPAVKTNTVKAPVAKVAERANELKDTIMTKAKTTAADYTTQVKEGLATAQERAKAAYDKGAELAAEMGEFSKGNLEAVVESGKILAAGVQTIAKTQFEDAKSAVEVMTADVKEMAAVKSPTDFVQLQGKLASRNFDAAVAQLSKTTEAWVKLANDTFAPISSRAAVAMEKVRKAA
ncbi:MAG: TIGR01841 family phasin [Sphingomonadaceae bacterium]|nr:TIGR01841 family phasin [Sphingomonadaceae bacterium]